eukprot:TRINITY_DN4646_c0_g1_i3.p1 TRINITY_DN4646_c0_g1~~TRINITY_DN4646_c0_g1_i3.p1  ORF type:complete len:1171 (+),score=310.50 TRINITY_DN4646_c0_g1_i3:67-3513(+)
MPVIGAATAGAAEHLEQGAKSAKRERAQAQVALALVHSPRATHTPHVPRFGLSSPRSETPPSPTFGSPAIGPKSPTSGKSAKSIKSAGSETGRAQTAPQWQRYKEDPGSESRHGPLLTPGAASPNGSHSHHSAPSPRQELSVMHSPTPEPATLPLALAKPFWQPLKLPEDPTARRDFAAALTRGEPLVATTPTDHPTDLRPYLDEIMHNLSSGARDQLWQAAQAVLQHAESQNLPRGPVRRCMLEAVGYIVRPRRQLIDDSCCVALVAAAWRASRPQLGPPALASELREALTEEFNGVRYHLPSAPADGPSQPQPTANTAPAIGWESPDLPLPQSPVAHMPRRPGQRTYGSTPPGADGAICISADLARALRAALQPPEPEIAPYSPSGYELAMNDSCLFRPQGLRTGTVPSASLSRADATPDLQHNGTHGLLHADQPFDDSMRGNPLSFDADKMMEIEETFFKLVKAHPSHRDNALGFSAMRRMWATVFPMLSMADCSRLTERLFQDIDTNEDQAIDWTELYQYLTAADEFSDSDKPESDLPTAEVPEGLQQWAWALLEYSATECYTSSTVRVLSSLLQVLVQVVIVVSSLNLLVESMPEYNSENTAGGGQMGNQTTIVVEVVCVSLFTIEFMARVLSCPLRHPHPELGKRLVSQANLWKRWFTYVDLLAILPFYIKLSGLGFAEGRSLVVLRMLRMLRISRALRILKLGRYSEGISIMVMAFKRASYALMWMGLLMVMSVTISATLMFYLELGEARFDDERHGWVTGPVESPVLVEFQSIPDAMWWAAVTVTTVGYGDKVPMTTEGKFLAVVTMVVGTLLVAFPVTILSNSFTQVFQDWMASKERRARRMGLHRMQRQSSLGNSGLSAAATLPTETTAPSIPQLSEKRGGGAMAKRQDSGVTQDDTCSLPPTQPTWFSSQTAADTDTSSGNKGFRASEEHLLNPLRRDSGGTTAMGAVSPKTNKSMQKRRRSTADTTDVALALRRLSNLTGRASQELLVRTPGAAGDPFDGDTLLRTRSSAILSEEPGGEGGGGPGTVTSSLLRTRNSFLRGVSDRMEEAVGEALGERGSKASNSPRLHDLQPRQLSTSTREHTRSSRADPQSPHPSFARHRRVSPPGALIQPIPEGSPVQVYDAISPTRHSGFPAA